MRSNRFHDRVLFGGRFSHGPSWANAPQGSGNPIMSAIKSNDETIAEDLLLAGA